MVAVNTRPWEDRFDIIHTEIVVETPELRAVRLTLGPGEEVPWHYHTHIEDRFICLEGAIEVEMRDPDAKHLLRPGQETMAPVKVAHIVRNAFTGPSTFMVIQGVGPYDYQAAE